MIRVKLTLLTQQTLLHTNPSHQDEPFQSRMFALYLPSDSVPHYTFKNMLFHVKPHRKLQSIIIYQESFCL